MKSNADEPSTAELLKIAHVTQKAVKDVNFLLAMTECDVKLEPAGVKVSLHDGRLRSSVKDNFISSNLACCIEMDGHGMLVFHNKCRDMGRPDLFLPTQLSSQQCEGTFRSFRSLTGTRSTIVNMDVLEMQVRSKKLQIIEEAPITIDNFKKHNANPKNRTHIATQLLTDNELASVIKSGFDSTVNTMLQFSK